MLTPSRPSTARSLYGSTRPTSARPWTASSTAGYSTRPSTARSSSAWCAPPPTVNKTWLQVKEGIDAAGATADARERALKREVLGAQLRRERDAGVARAATRAHSRRGGCCRRGRRRTADSASSKDMLRIEARRREGRGRGVDEGRARRRRAARRASASPGRSASATWARRAGGGGRRAAPRGGRCWMMSTKATRARGDGGGAPPRPRQRKWILSERRPTTRPSA